MLLFIKISILLILFSTSNLFAFDTTQIIFHVHGDTTTSRLGQNLTALGDINNDGYDDIAISSVYPKGTYIYYGGFPIDTVADMFITGNLGAADPIDLDGDGINEIITTELVNQFPDKISILYFYKGYLDSIASIPYDSLNPPIDNYNLGGSGLEGVKTNYIDSDLLGDLLTFQLNKPGGQKLLYYGGLPAIDKSFDWSFQVLNYSHYFSGFGFIDFNGDNFQDIYLGLGPDTDSLGFIYIFLGPSFDTMPNIIIEHPKDLDSLNPDFFVNEIDNIGDVNGDGWEDLGVRFHNTNLIYLCGLIADTLYDYKLDFTHGEMSKAGDINNDGYNDLICGEGRTMDGIVDIYVGGQEFDRYVDDAIFRSDLPPVFIDFIGYELSPAGDFNGDGIKDFMFSTQNFAFGDPGEVFVIAGSTNIVTDVEEIITTKLPINFNLKQNYPNPFNPSTTIEFQIPKKEHVTLSIYNTLGQKIRTLINKELSVGSYSLKWDGNNEGGEPVSSGVYFYQLSNLNTKIEYRNQK